MLVFYPLRRTYFRPILKTPANRLKCLALLKNPTETTKATGGKPRAGDAQEPFSMTSSNHLRPPSWR